MSTKYNSQARNYLGDLRRHHDTVTDVPPSQPGSTKLAFKVPLLLVFFFVFAAGTGVAHHFFYSFLDGRLAENQAWMLRAGTALAYVAKLLFALSIGSAFSQRLWQSLRSKYFTLGAVDNLFDLKNDPTRLLKLEVLASAKVAVLLALSIWALPILPIIAPGSISVKAKANTLNNQVPATTLNFSRSHDPFDPLARASIYTVNFADVVGNGAAFNGYSGPSSRAKGLIYSTVYGGQALPPDSPCGSNCTFNQTFNGPAYRCQDVDYTKADPKNPFCSNMDCTEYFSSPTRNAFDIEWYAAKNSSGNTCTDCTGDTWHDGKLWVKYQYLLPQYRTQSGDPPTNATPIPDSAFEKHVFVCQSYNATYTLQKTYINFQQSVVGELNFLNPINYSLEAFQGSEGVTPYAGYAVHQQLFQILSGNIGLDGRMRRIDSTGLGGTQLVEQQPFPQPNLTSTSADNSPGTIGIQKPVRNLRAAIEQLHFNITVGMLTIPHLIYLQNETTAAYVTTFENRWNYNWLPLVAAYGGCALINVLAILIGAAAIIHNDGLGVGRTGFLRMLMTSRNPTLDAIVGMRGRGDDDMQTEIEDMKVKFGELRNARTGNGNGYVAFGAEGEVLELRKR